MVILPAIKISNSIWTTIFIIMVNRRHIRIKVMQSIYAVLQSKSDNLSKEEKFLLYNIKKATDLYVLQLLLLAEIKIMLRQIKKGPEGE